MYWVLGLVDRGLVFRAFGGKTVPKKRKRRETEPYKTVVGDIKAHTVDDIHPALP